MGSRQATAVRFRWFGLLLLISLSSACLASTRGAGPIGIRDREVQMWHLVFRHLPLAAPPQAGGETGCEAVRPPEPLATPDPLLPALGFRVRVKVSFIIGVDGQVHSPVVLESAGLVDDREVLDTLQLWRYRPAICNSVPAEIEAKVEFSSR